MRECAMTTNPYLRLHLWECLQGLERGDFSCEDITRAYLDQIHRAQGLGAYITVTTERALQDAQASDERRKNGRALPLDGIPVAVKDAYCTRGVLTTAASQMLHNYVPAYEATVTQKLWEAGAVLLGKTKMDEFCMGSTTTPVRYGPSRNPWDPTCTTGGSSGGSAAAVASGSALCALGSDTGGSVRQPAAFCGVVGVKPAYGRCSRRGLIAFASSLDHPGPLGRCVKDTALLLETMSGHDPLDSTSLPVPVPPFSQAIGRSVEGLVVGIPQGWENLLDSEMQAVWEKGKDWLKDAGCCFRTVSLPYISHALSSYYILVCAEAASNLQRYDGVKYGFRAQPSSVGSSLEEMYSQTRREGFGPEVKRRILMGIYVLSHGYYEAYYGKALQVRKLIQQDFARAFQEVEVILAPTTPTPAFSLQDASLEDPVQMYRNDVLTVPVNIGNITAISVPAGLSKRGLPLGLQIMAPSLQEERLFSFGAVIEQCASMPPMPFSSVEVL